MKKIEVLLIMLSILLMIGALFFTTPDPELMWIIVAPVDDQDLIEDVIFNVTLASLSGIDLPSWTRGEIGGYTANERLWWYDSSAEGTGFVYGPLKSEQVGSSKCAGIPESWYSTNLYVYPKLPEFPATPAQPEGIWINIFDKKIWWRF